MDPFRIKHVLNELAAFLKQHRALPNFAQLARRACWEVAVLLLEGQAGYDRLHIAAPGLQGLRTPAQLAEHAVFAVASRWNADRASSGVVG